MKNRIIYLLVIILAAAWTVITPRLQPVTVAQEEVSSPLEGNSAPDFSLQDLTGFHYSLSDMQGRVVVLNFWASWCTPCQAEMPAFQRVFDSYDPQKVVILGVNVTIQDKINNVLEFVEEKQLTFPILLDESGTVTTAYAIYAMPTTFFIDKEGVIQKVIMGGPIPEAVIRAEISKLEKD